MVYGITELVVVSALLCAEPGDLAGPAEGPRAERVQVGTPMPLIEPIGAADLDEMDQRVYVAAEKLTHGDNWFSAELVLDHGESVRALLGVHSQPDGSWTIREKLVAQSDVTTTRIATGLIGILNKPGWVYEDGGRTIAIDGRPEKVPALSGRELAADWALPTSLP